MKIKNSFLDRIEQSIYIFKDNFKELLIPILAYKIIVFLLVTFFLFVLTIYFWSDFSWVEYLYELTYDPYFLSFAWISFFLWLCLLVFSWLVLMFYYKTISNIVNEKELNFKSDALFAINNTWRYMILYWYIFRYVYLLPALLFIFAWVSYLVWVYYDINFLFIITWVLMTLFILVFIYFAIYRWTKTTLSLANWVASDFSESSFKQSLIYSNWKFFRLFFNIIGFWLISYIVFGIISWILWIIFFIWNWGSSIMEVISKALSNPDNAEDIINNFALGSSWFITYIKEIIDIFITSLQYVIWVTFVLITYERFKREYEVKWKTQNNENLKDIEANEF